MSNKTKGPTPSRAVIAGITIICFALFMGDFGFSSKYSLTNDDINTIINNTTQAFAQAEGDVFDVSPDIPDDKPLVPDPDPTKCICGGTGKIIHGDGHVTDCPYHAKTAVNNNGSCLCVSCSCNMRTKTRKLLPLFNRN
jgi:hypothetical protein